jgi:hypothetical protein
MSNALVPLVGTTIDITAAIQSAIDTILAQVNANLGVILGAAGTFMAVGIVWGLFRKFMPKK